MSNNIDIKEVKVADEYELISGFMLELHKNEHRLHDKTADWADIEKSYMRHVITSQEDNEGVCLVAYADGKPAGFMFGFTEEQDDSNFEIIEGKELYISDGYIAPEFRRLGLYRKMNDQMERTFNGKGVQRITRMTLVNNTGMRQLLESEGYKVTRLLYEKWL